MGIVGSAGYILWGSLISVCLSPADSTVFSGEMACCTWISCDLVVVTLCSHHASLRIEWQGKLVSRQGKLVLSPGRNGDVWTRHIWSACVFLSLLMASFTGMDRTWNFGIRHARYTNIHLPPCEGFEIKQIGCTVGCDPVLTEKIGNWDFRFFPSLRCSCTDKFVHCPHEAPGLTIWFRPQGVFFLWWKPKWIAKSLISWFWNGSPLFVYRRSSFTGKYGI